MCPLLTAEPFTYMMNCSNADLEVYEVLQAVCPFFVSFLVTLSSC